MLYLVLQVHIAMVTYKLLNQVSTATFSISHEGCTFISKSCVDFCSHFDQFIDLFSCFAWEQFHVLCVWIAMIDTESHKVAQLMHHDKIGRMLLSYLCTVFRPSSARMYLIPSNHVVLRMYIKHLVSLPVPSSSVRKGMVHAVCTCMRIFRKCNHNTIHLFVWSCALCTCIYVTVHDKTNHIAPDNNLRYEPK